MAQLSLSDLLGPAQNIQSPPITLTTSSHHFFPSRSPSRTFSPPPSPSMAISSAAAEAIATPRLRLVVRAASSLAAQRPGAGAPLPEFRGLRASLRRPRAPAMASGRRGSVVCRAQEAAALDDVPDVAKSTWDQLVLGCEMPVLVEFWAPWCGPCRLMHPVIANLLKTYGGRLKCFKLNTDDNQDVATRYGIRSIPTIMIFKNGEKKDTIIGAVPETTLVTTVERFL